MQVQLDQKLLGIEPQEKKKKKDLEKKRVEEITGKGEQNSCEWR